MLRITIQHAPPILTFRLEGRLAGPWVRELEECWQGALADQSKPVLRVDLTEVTSLDAAGQAYLEAMHRQGAEFVAADCLMKAVVAEITRARLPDSGSPKSEAASRSEPAEIQPPRAARGRRGRPKPRTQGS